jgi:prevent-host-death family protein
MRSVTIAELKDHLSAHLRSVEAGEEIVVTDRRRPIARIVRISPLASRVEIIPPRRDFAELRDLPRQRIDLGISSTVVLLEERQDRDRLHR